MRFAVSLTIDQSAKKKSGLIHNLFSQINAFLRDNNFGEDIKEYFIGMLVVNPPPGYEHLHKIHKPKFTEYKSLINKFTGEPLEIIRQFHYSLKITGDDYVEFVNLSDNESKKMLARLIFDSFEYLDKLPKKVKDFDKDGFVTGMELFFRDQGLI